MNLKDIDQINQDPGFIEYRVRNQKYYLWALTIGILVNIITFQFLGPSGKLQSLTGLHWLMAVSAVMFILNHFIAIYRANQQAIKQHLTIGFYLTTIFYTLFTIITGAGSSPFLYGLFLVLFGWFVIIPYSYKALIAHSISFTLLLMAGIVFQPYHSIDIPEILKIIIFYSATLIAGAYVAVKRNLSDSANYKAQLLIKKNNEELIRKQQLIDTILSDAPMILWSMDLKGRLTYIQGKSLEKFEGGSELFLGKTVSELFSGKEVEEFIDKIIKDEVQDGTIQVGPVIFDTHVSPLLNENNEKSGFIGVSMDITDRIRTSDQMNKFRLILDQAPGAVFIMDKDSNFEYINPYFTKISGYTEEDLLHKNIKDTLYKGIEGFVPESRKEIIKNLAEGKSWQGELLTYHKNGSTYWANTIAAPYANNRGNIEGYIVIQQDISDKIKIENALRESESLYRTLIEKSMEGIVLTRNADILMVNDAFCNIFGYTREELHTIATTDLIAPEDRERVVGMHFKRMRGEIGSISYSAKMLHKNGSVRQCEINASTVLVDGLNTSFITMNDVTERIAIESALRENEEKYKTLVENSQDGITIIKDNKILFANDTCCKMLGYTRDELYNMPSVSTLHPSEHEKAYEIAKRRHNQDFSTINEVFLMLTKDGQIKECETSSTLIQYNGEWASFFTSHDITESKRMQLAIKENEEKYRLLFEAESDAIFMIDVETGDIVDVNPAATRTYGYSRDEFLKMKNTDVSAEPDKTRTATSRSETLVPLRYHKRKDGVVIPVELSAGFTDLNGRKIQIVTSRDISERVKNQEALRESEAKYRELVETTNSIILKWDKDFKVTFLNEYGLKFFGFTREEIFGQPAVGTIIPATEQNTGRNLYSMIEDIFRNPSKYEQNINENMKKSGERVWISWNNTAIKDDNGVIINMYSVGTDITERKNSEEELKITKEKLQLLNQNLEQQVIDTANKLTEANTQLIRLQKENLQSQFEVLRQQVNPHFLFNSLNVLTSLIKLEPDLAEKFTEHLSKVYRYVLENKDNDLVSLATELDFLDAYLFLLNIRFMDKIKVVVDIEEDKKELLVLPLALQLIIENAIKHNTMSKKAPLFIKIFIDNELMLNITNNLQERESNMISTGVGLNNIKHRYELLEMQAPEFYKSENHFIARVPLKSSEN